MEALIELIQYIVQNLINALQRGSFYAVISIGYSMVYGVLMLFNFAHGDIFMVATYIGFGIATLFLALFAGFIPGPLIFLATIVITMFLASWIGVFVEVAGYRPLRSAPRASAAITGLMIGIIFETSILILLGAKRLSFPPLMESIAYNVGGVYFTNVKVMIIIISLLLMLALHTFIQKTKWGMAMRAMSYDFLAVPLMGVSINVIAPLTFAVGAGLAAVAGILYGQAYPILDPYMGVIIGWKAFVAAILGGRGSIKGAALAGYLLGFIEIFVATIFPSTLRDLIAYSIILLILTYRPRGFFGMEHSTKLRL
ncbi:MAG: branched-chain amino acid ABC transporter permease [Desulfobacula sp.]|jgi:branched-chain amino acid transport system permease protein|uniref:branched-chain amino acid ABC transporter permease n=2 Tax=Desulfobacula sp. TaxID=2593537 RepID=UPI001D21AEE4|nr:branched-chain amino acid ABC transporter permease [Desulfobacula sp.]MBT3484656.1 branched-chain amino acid ABC transporter permease [Desulfobacula sp.]MBT3807349.1 branched-chain amino acid ABC transporter permease [Desulfobacula sp.]MBT4509031.1 branched-chain amino acid ABC transporter permease [Desulfobacula sp.]MBT4874373.1 branched-chain amino acid ABC transporter permease [Desulfobacula sp.]